MLSKLKKRKEIGTLIAPGNVMKAQDLNPYLSNHIKQCLHMCMAINRVCIQDIEIIRLSDSRR